MLLCPVYHQHTMNWFSVYRAEDCLTLMHDSLRRLFRALYILPRRTVTEEFLSAIDQVRHRLRKNLQDYEPFLAVKAQRNLAITRYVSQKIIEKNRTHWPWLQSGQPSQQMSEGRPHKTDIDVCSFKKQCLREPKSLVNLPIQCMLIVCVLKVCVNGKSEPYGSWTLFYEHFQWPEYEHRLGPKV